MKYILSLILSIGVVTCSAQITDSIEHFYAEDSEVYWEKVFNTSLRFNDLAQKIKESGVLLSVSTEENRIFGDIRSIIADYKGAGFKRGFTPIYILANKFEGFATILFKEGRYKVILRKIRTVEILTGGFLKEGHQSQIEMDFLKNDKKTFRDRSNESAKILDYSFVKSFDFNKEIKNKDW